MQRRKREKETGMRFQDQSIGRVLAVVLSSHFLSGRDHVYGTDPKKWSCVQRNSLSRDTTFHFFYNFLLPVFLGPVLSLFLFKRCIDRPRETGIENKGVLVAKVKEKREKIRHDQHSTYHAAAIFFHNLVLLLCARAEWKEKEEPIEPMDG